MNRRLEGLTQRLTEEHRMVALISGTDHKNDCVTALLVNIR